MTEAYCSYEISKLLKEKGFNEPCSSTYDTAVSGGKPKFYKYDVLHFFPNGMKNSDDKYGMVISAPTHQIAMAWLREKAIYITIIYGDYPANKKVFWTPQIDSLEGFDLPNSFYQEYDLYEDAVEAALKYCLENLI